MIVVVAVFFLCKKSMIWWSWGEKCENRPALALKNVKNGGFLRVCGVKMGGGAVKMVFFVSGWVSVV